MKNMKSWFNCVIFYPIENILFNYGKIEAQKTINEIFDNLDDVDYNPEFIEEMNEIKKEKPIAVVKCEDLFNGE